MLADEQDKGSEELAQCVPNAVSQNQSTTDVAGRPPRDIHRKGGLKGSNADPGQHLGPSPISPVADQSLDDD